MVSLLNAKVKQVGKQVVSFAGRLLSSRVVESAILLLEFWEILPQPNPHFKLASTH